MGLRKPLNRAGFVVFMFSMIAQGYGLHSEDELLFEVGDSNINHRWYLEDFIERWDRIA